MANIEMAASAAKQLMKKLFLAIQWQYLNHENKHLGVSSRL